MFAMLVCADRMTPVPALNFETASGVATAARPRPGSRIRSWNGAVAHWRIQRGGLLGGGASFGRVDLTYPHFQLSPRI